jgi:hypothetical protein
MHAETNKLTQKAPSRGAGAAGVAKDAQTAGRIG